MSVHLGLLLPTRESVMTQDEPRFGPILELAEQAEAQGLDAVWAGDSVLARPRFEAITTLAAVAARTRRVSLGTAVLLPALRHPVVLANELANVDLISEGRVILGTGTASRNAPNEREFEAAGIPFRRRIGVYDESIAVLRALWSGEPVTYHGRHVNLDRVRAGLLPARPGGIPIWLSGGEDRSFQRILEHGDGWITLAASPEGFAAGWQRLQAMGAEAGRDLTRVGRCAYVTLNIDDDIERATEQMRGFVEGYYGERYEDHILTHAFCPGPAEHCRRWLQSFVDAGADTIIVRFSRSNQSEQLERFATEVLPGLRDGT